MAKQVPSLHWDARNHSLTIPACVSECGGIRIFGRRIKSLAFSTDVAIIKNINADAIIAVYPFTPQPVISQAIISVSDVPGIRGRGRRNHHRLPLRPAGHPVRAPGCLRRGAECPHLRRCHPPDQKVVDIPVVITVVSAHTDIGGRLEAGADFLNVSGAAATPEIVAEIRRDFPKVPIIATGGPTEESILRTIQAGANAITYTPPSNGVLFARIMNQHRKAL